MTVCVVEQPVSRDVIRDLWALCEAGEASEDSRRLVDAALAEDPELARLLRSSRSGLAEPVPSLPADHEVQTLTRMKQRLGRRSPLRLLALALTGLAVARLFERASLSSFPRDVIALSVAAVLCWLAYGWHSRYLQQKAVFGR